MLLVPVLSAQPRLVAPKKAARTAAKADLMIQRLQRLTPAERRRVLDNLPPERRRTLEHRLQELRHMTPEERRQAARALEDFRNLPPERQMKVRRLYNRFGWMPQDRRTLLSEEIRSLRELSTEERRARFDSEEFRGKYSPAEQRWLSEVSSALYDQ
jgi:hypothetical protein